MSWETVITRWRAALHQAEALFDAEDWTNLALMTWQVPQAAIEAQPTADEVAVLRELRSRSDALQQRVMRRLDAVGSQIGTDATRRLAARAYISADVL